MAAASTAAWARCSFNGGWKRFQMSPCCSTICFYHFTFVFSRFIVWLFESFNWFGCFCVQLIGLLSVVSNFFCLFLLSNVDVSFLQLLFSVVQWLIFLIVLIGFQSFSCLISQIVVSSIFNFLILFDKFQLFFNPSVVLIVFSSCAASFLLILSVSPFFHLSFFRIFCAFNLWEFNCCLFHQLFQSFQCLHLFDHLNCLHVSFIVSFILFRHFSIVSIHSFNHSFVAHFQLFQFHAIGARRCWVHLGLLTQTCPLWMSVEYLRCGALAASVSSAPGKVVGC